MQINFVGHAYTARSKNLSAQRCLNLYPETGDAQNAALLGTPGLRLLATLPGSGGIRGMHVPSSGTSIVVRGNTVYRVALDFTATSCGTILTSAGVVSIADNGTVAVIVDGPYGYVLNLLTNALTRITDPAFYGSDIVQYLDSYFVFNKPGTQQFYISLIGTTNFDALDFASAEGAPDRIVSFIVDHREVWFFGDSSTEIFYNSGNADFPLTRRGEAFIEVGCAARHSVAKLDNSIFWLGKDANGSGTVWRANGYSPARISTHAIEFAIASYAVIDDAIAYTYQQEGHSFYVLTFPTANATWVFDVATGAWHERAWRNPEGLFKRHRSNCHMFYSGKHVVGDWENGKLYALDLDYYSDDGDAIAAVRAAPVLSVDQKMQYFKSFQLIIEPGVGLVSGQGSDPQVALDWSDDHGNTWSSETFATMGKMGAIGTYKTRLRWTRLGRARNRIFRVTITDPIKRVIIGATAEMQPGMR